MIAMVTRIVIRWQVQRRSAVSTDSVMMTFGGSSNSSPSVLRALASLLAFLHAARGVHILVNSQPKEREDKDHPKKGLGLSVGKELQGN